MKINSGLQRLIDKSKEILSLRDKIDASISAAVALQVTAEGRLQDALESLGAAEAEAAVSGQVSSGADVGALVDARAVVETVAARIHGLQRKREALAEEIASVSIEMEAARGEFREECISEYHGQLIKAVDGFRAALKRGAALADALGDTQLESAIRRIRVVDPTGISILPLIDLNTTEFRERTTIPIAPWRGDAAAERVFNEHSEPFAVYGALANAKRRLESA